MREIPIKVLKERFLMSCQTGGTLNNLGPFSFISQFLRGKKVGIVLAYFNCACRGSQIRGVS